MVRGSLQSISVQLISAHSRECEREYSLGDELNLICNEIHRRFETCEALKMIIPVLLIDIRRSSTNILSMERLIEELTEVKEGIFSESDFWSRARVQEIVNQSDMGVETHGNPFLEQSNA
jgi:hypothetical protein